jgi:hypothetical protein
VPAPRRLPHPKAVSAPTVDPAVRTAQLRLLPTDPSGQKAGRFHGPAMRGLPEPLGATIDDATVGCILLSLLPTDSSLPVSIFYFYFLGF